MSNPRYLYHGTTEQNAAFILREGLKPGGKRGSFVSYLAATHEMAQRHGSVVLKVRVPHGTRLSSFDDCPEEVLCWDKIPADYITLSDIGGFNARVSSQGAR